MSANTLLALHAVSLSVIAFSLHGVWEYFQCRLFFVHRGLPPTASAMLGAVGGDVALTWLTQLIAALVSRNWLWALRRWQTPQWLCLVVCALVLSGLIEWHALSTGRWAYTQSAPIVPGLRISIVPIGQLLLLFPLTFGLTAAVVRSRR